MQVSPTFALGLEANRRLAEHETAKLHYGMPKGLTQTLTSKELEVIESHHRADEAKKRASQPDVRKLTHAEMKQMHGSGPYRNHYLAGQPAPWHRTFHDVNLCTGNLFKTFTDMQVAPGRGAGLVLSRTYSSQDPRIGPFGVGWSNAYDIRNIEDGGNNVDNTGFFGRSDTYHRDADGLLSAPAFKHDILEGTYGTTLVNGQYPDLADTDTGMDGTIKHYFTNGNERDCDVIQDRHGNTTTLTYDGSVTLADGRHPLKYVTDPSNRSIVFTWANIGTTTTPAWRVTQVQGPFINSTPIAGVTSTPTAWGSSVPGITYRVTYDYFTDTNDPNAADNLYNLQAVHLDPDGLNRTKSYTYTHVTGTAGTENALLASITDPLGHVASYTYAASYNNYFLYQSALNNPAVYANGPTVTGTAWVMSITEPAGIDASGNQRTIEWDVVSANSTSNGTWLRSSSGMWCFTMTDQYLRCTQVSNTPPDQDWVAGHLTTYTTTYDTSNNMLTRNGWTFRSGIPNSAVIYTSDTSTYGATGNVLTHSSIYQGPLETNTYYGAEEYFQKHVSTDMNGNASTYAYGLNTDSNFGNRGSVLTVQDARSSITGKQTSYTYNQYGQKLTETNQNGTVTQYTYGDQFGNLTQVVQDPGDSSHLNRTTTMSYDAAGRVITSTDPNGNVSTFTYNVLGQPQTTTAPPTANTPSETITYTYDANGRTATVSDNRGTTSMAYEAGCDRVHSVTDPVTGTLSYSYTITGEKATETLPGGGTWTNYYSESGHEVTLLPKDDPASTMLALSYTTDDQGRRCDYTMDGRGAIATLQYNETYNGGGSLVSSCLKSYTYDGVITAAYSHYWLSQITTTFSGASNPLNKNVYTYDNIGQRLTNAVTDNTGTTHTDTYGYDAINRLTNVTYGDTGQTQTYTFDPMGNRTQLVDSANGTHNYTYDAANRLTALDSATPNYVNDANGNTLTGGGRTNTWDSGNRLTQCVYTSGTTTNTSNFTYGSDDLRHRAVVNDGTNTTTTDYVLDGDDTVREMRNGTAFATYFTGIGGPVYRRSDLTGSVSWYVYDGLGSVVAEVSPTGVVTAGDKYDVYGSLRSRTGTATTSHGFVGSLGHQSEANTGLIYMRARYYDPSIGRFASEDPSLNGTNWYIYAGDNPCNVCDRDGMAAEAWYIALLVALLTAIKDILVDVAKDLFKERAKKMAEKELAELAEAAAKRALERSALEVELAGTDYSLAEALRTLSAGDDDVNPESTAALMKTKDDAAAAATDALYGQQLALLGEIMMQDLL